MKKISMVLMLAITIVSCQNTGDKNQSDIKVRETDSAIKATDPNDAAGSSGRNDTAMTPNKTTNAAATTSAPGNSTGKDSTGQGGTKGQKTDSSKSRKQ